MVGGEDLEAANAASGFSSNSGRCQAGVVTFSPLGPGDTEPSAWAASAESCEATAESDTYILTGDKYLSEDNELLLSGGSTCVGLCRDHASNFETYTH